MIELRPYQQQVVDSVLESIRHRRGLTFSVEIARQGGKNELSAHLEMALLSAGCFNPVNIVKCAPTFKPQAQISLRRLADRLTERHFSNDFHIEDGHIIRLNKSRVIFLSAGQDSNVVGNTAHLLLEADEAQDIDADKFDRDFKPMAAVSNATTVLYGTPWDGRTLLEATKARNLELERTDGLKRHFSFNWREVARYNPAYGAFVDNEKSRLGPDHPIFRSQYELEPINAGGGFLNTEQLAQLAGSHRPCDAPESGKVYVAGLDLGGDSPNADASVLSIAEIDLACSFIGLQEPFIKVVRHYAWTGLPITALLPKIIDLARRWAFRRLVVDATGMGQPLAALLIQALGSRVKPFIFTAASKSELGFDFLAAVNTGRVKLFTRDHSPECAACWQQLQDARAEYRANRTINFYVNSHDDYLTSLLLAFNAACRYQPRAARGFNL
ncbi:hypothetical protein DGWBC_0381 [Dehalogenimonas sp. WBC-2]|nr:hypothetical protein DGWBC_0381 [Dehalogenimonas sp. WBC-2]